MSSKLTAAELKECRYALFAEWEMAQGIEWTVNGVNMPKLYKKLTKMIEAEGLPGGWYD